ncbi:MAG: NRDE family protein [Balneolaceae bacterium]|nr:NRDE family protein [Balneolaceae bacterium]
MCLIVFAVNAHPNYPLILAGNRDEFYERPADSAAIWNTEPKIIAGKDLKAGGTWLGVSETGRIAALTNYRDMRQIKEDAPSRGDIVKEILTSQKSVPDFLFHLKESAHQYNGFNLLAGSSDAFYYFSSVPNSYHQTEPGVYSISNALLNTPWPKTEWTEQKFTKLLNSGELNNDELFSMLQNKSTYPAEMLPDTGLSEKLERAVSAVFIKTENYGTRCSTVVKVNKKNVLTFEERTYTPETGHVSAIRTFEIPL